MPISITARNEEITGTHKDYAEGKAKAIMDTFPGVERVNVVLDKLRHNYIAEIQLQAKRRFRADAADTAENMRKSIDQAFEKIEKQMRRRVEKGQSYRKQ